MDRMDRMDRVDIIHTIKHMINESIPFMTNRIPHTRILENMVLLHWEIRDGQDDLWDMFYTQDARYRYFDIIKDIFGVYPEYWLDVKYTLGPVAIREKIYTQIVVSLFTYQNTNLRIEV